jgi:hypothetical protein
MTRLSSRALLLAGLVLVPALAIAAYDGWQDRAAVRAFWRARPIETLPTLHRGCGCGGADRA